jgi:hypothetical protein
LASASARWRCPSSVQRLGSPPRLPDGYTASRREEYMTETITPQQFHEATWTTSPAVG